ncbi:sulfite reductase flavo protein alpha-component [Patellaria atrata CBS 101060]|uniref:NADPH-dependent diflavin oxidoreductase 1 n=1 Tax=Patellaria atrata CBS 101060 TaxID=1346257 RepID=A0A9P4S6I2_9PEZI|nr:sulfite reductase flavo protein alpha-component [Patellaria atrata CBS 101060]
MSLVDRTALVLYGSETGNAQDVAEELGRLTERLRFSTEVKDLNSVELNQLLRATVVIIAISTTGQGNLPANSRKFWRTLRSVRLPPGCLNKVRMTVFGLGDSSYSQFNWAARKLHKRLIQLGAQSICDRGEADEQDSEGTDGQLIPWSLKLRETLLEQYPLPDGIDPIPDNILLRPKLLLEFLPDSSDPLGTAPIQREDSPPDDLLPVLGSHTATLYSNKRITPVTHWQDVRHLTFSLPGTIPYAPGDAMTIYPKNFPSDVSQFISLFDWTSIADRPLHFVRMVTHDFTGASPLPPPPINHGFLASPLTIRTLLTNHLDIMSIPRRSFFSLVAHFTTDEFQRNRLLEFTNPEFIDELFDYTTRPRRSILEVLQEFETVKIPWQWLCTIIPFMRGRQFSIASGGIHNLISLPNGELRTKVELLVAIVKYKTVIKRIRQGVCTRYIASLRPDQDITVTFHKGDLHVSRAEADKSAIMIATGTGVAPMRSLIWERVKWAGEPIIKQNANGEQESNTGIDSPVSPGPNLLFFGNRNRAADFFFQDEWTYLADQWTRWPTSITPEIQSKLPALAVFTAFSRDQRHKIYVQDLLVEQSALVYDHLVNRQGIVFICGSSGKMPTSVKDALVKVLEKEGEMERMAAEGYLAGLEKGGRIRQDTW